MFLSLLSSVGRLFRGSPSKGSLKPNRYRHRARLQVEELGPRIVPANITYTVNTLADTHDADLFDPAAADANGNTSLRAAIEQGNTLGVGDKAIIQFQPGLTGTISLTSALDPLAKTFTIVGPGSAAMIVSAGATLPGYRVFEIAFTSTTSIQGLSIVGGNAGVGGGVYNAGTLGLLNCNVKNNVAFTAAGIYNVGTLTVDSCNVYNNSAAQDAGGILNSATLTVINSWIYSNTAERGAGIYNNVASTANVINTQIFNNIANSLGGGVRNSGTFTMDGGALSTNTARVGGGIYNTDTATLSNVSIQGNRGTQKGGGFYALNGLLTLNGGSLGNNVSPLGAGGAFVAQNNYQINGTVIMDPIVLDPNP